MKKVTELRVRKNEIRAEWEKCFEMNMEDKFTEEGMKHFYDEGTPFEEALAMLDAAAIDDVIGDVLDMLFGDDVEVVKVGIVKKKPVKKEKADTGCKFRVILTGSEEFIYSDKFDTPDEANQFIRETCMTTSYQLKDFKVVQEMDS